MFPGLREVERQRQDSLPKFEVFEENWESYLAFLKVSTQWRLLLPPMGGKRAEYLGLDYAGVLAYLKATKQIKLFADIQMLEAGALAALNERPLPDLHRDDPV